jgi:serine/threonine-protein kinase PknG
MSVASERCTREGCDGEIEDGYCNVCGMAAPASAPSGATPTGGGSSAGSGTAGNGTAGNGTAGSGTVGSGTVGSGTVGSGTVGSGTTGRTGSRGTRGSRSTSIRGNLGAGLVEVPPVPYRDPSSVVLADPEVPERKRFCAVCDRPVGRSRDGSPGRTEGFCASCGSRFSFAPKLVAGDLIAGQYRVVGCIAHGGLGWIYLARDQNVSDRWVVLKGLLDSGDESAMAAAIAERRFLAEVEHPNIVRIYNFVEHDGAGYIVMEYVGGESLKEVRTSRRAQTGEAIPVAEAIAYMLEILPALGYLHARGLLYCDFKPDNAIQSEEQLRLIDLGGVRRAEDQDSDLYGTVGYQAPEVAALGASVASDLYTVGRTLAVLSFDFPGFQDEQRYAASLPPATEIPLLARYESVHKLLLKATAIDPQRRFGSAAEMGEQLLGVLRQVIAIDGGRPATAPSRLFTGEGLTDGSAASWRDLPVPVVDTADPAAGVLANLTATDPEQVKHALQAAPQTVEVTFRLARTLIDEGDYAAAHAALDGVPAQDSDDWRVQWWLAMLALAQDTPRRAQERLNELTFDLPGELAPRLGLAVADELAAQEGGPDRDEHLRAAARGYEIVAATDPSYASASFGLARVRQALGDRAGAGVALRRIPAASSAYAAAQIALCRALCGELAGQPPAIDDLRAGAVALSGVHGDPEARAALRRDLLIAALAALERDETQADPSSQLAGVPLSVGGVRTGLEDSFRELAKHSPSPEVKISLVDQANHYRPRTLT